MAWRTLESRLVYENPWIRVREDRVVRPDESDGIYGVIEMQNTAVFVVAVDDDDRVVLVDIDRYTTGPSSIEVPAGGTDGEDPLVAAQRELLEETGLAADEWTAIGGMYALNGVAVAEEVVFLARHLHDAASTAAVDATQAADGIDGVRRVAFGDVLRMIAAGEIRDGESIAAISLAGIHLGRFR